jgi:hypothetical protein
MFDISEKEFCVMIPDIVGMKNMKSILDPLPKDNFRRASHALPRECLVEEMSLEMLAHATEGKDIFSLAERIYFGQETCARKLFSARNVAEAVSLAEGYGKKLSLVVPYAGERDMADIRSVLEFFGKECPGGEVVVNDLGIINVIAENKLPVKTVLGRLLSRIKRDPRFGSFPPMDMTALPDDFSAASRENISRSGFSARSFSDFFNKLGISRAGCDALPQGVDMSDVEGFTFDVYWPWIYVTSGRSCQILGADDSRKGKYPMESDCGRECLKFEMKPPRQGRFYSVIRGNAVWMEVMYPGNMAGDFSRFIYEPVIPA